MAARLGVVVLGHATHLEHVGVRPARRARVLRLIRLPHLQPRHDAHQIGHDTIPEVDDVSRGAEEVVRAPALRHLVGIAAVGDVLALVAVLDLGRLATRVEELPVERHILLRAAAVDLDRIEAPRNRRLHVALVIDRLLDLLVAAAAVEVKAHLDAFAVTVLDESGHVGKALRVDGRRAVDVVHRPVDAEAAALPALVDADRVEAE